MKYLRLIILSILLYGCSQREPQYLSDKNLLVIKEQISPNDKYKMLEYQFDHGGFGYSRIFWAIIPKTLSSAENITKYILPDGYKALEWSASGEAIVEEWKPYYYKEDDVHFRTGDKFQDIIIKLVTK